MADLDLTAYSPDQARDESGRFGSGASAASKSAHEKTSAAKKSGTWIDHSQAGFAHREAAAAHGNAAQHAKTASVREMHEAKQKRARSESRKTFQEGYGNRKLRNIFREHARHESTPA